MSNLTEELAEEVVSAFKAELDEAIQSQIGSAQFERLKLLVRDALSAGIHNAAERAEKLARELRSEAGSHEIEL